MRSFVDLLNRFRADERGVFAVIFGLMAIVLVAMAGAAVDYTSLEAARARAQIALDSAALGLAPTIYTKTADQLKTTAQALVVERLHDSSVTVTVDTAVATTATGTLRLEGSLTVPMAFIQLVGISSMTARVKSEATRGSVNLEVGVALDTTGSMKKEGIEALQSALATLIPLVVKDTQVPTYSKMALVPYSTAVDVGAARAVAVRGPILPAKTVSSATWWDFERDISTATAARPVVIGQNAHGFNNNDVIYISGVKGMTELNNKGYVVKNKTPNSFELYNIDGSRVDGRNYKAFQVNAAAKMKHCTVTATCNIIINATNHGFATGDFVKLTDFSGNMSNLNGNSAAITKINNNSFSIDIAGYSDTYVQPASSGKAWCTNYGCEYYKPKSDSNTVLKATASCVTERMTNSFNDVAPSNTLLSINYTSDGACGITEKILPLTSDKTELLKYTASGALKWSGNTAGQIGTAWAWYLVAPAFGELFTTASKPAAYDAPNTLKIVIIMTDGAYNQEYCKGVVTGSAACSAPKGTTGTMSGPFGQAEDLCHNMKLKEKGVVVYTVGFNLGTTGDPVDVLKKCASDPGKAKLANDSAGLIKAFREIGENISDLRLSQ